MLYQLNPLALPTVLVGKYTLGAYIHGKRDIALVAIPYRRTTS